jgi:hypothetical protein
VYFATPAAGTPQKENSLTLIPAGPFQMGNATAPDAPEQTVEVGALYVGRTEVTKGAWDAVQKWAGQHGYTFSSNGQGLDVDLPVNSVSWCDMLKWCNARSEMEGVIPSLNHNRSFSAPTRGRPLAAHGYVMGLVPFKTVSPAGAPQEDATIWNGPGKLECPCRACFVRDQIPMALPWPASELPLGASDLAEVPTGFLKNSA